MSTNYSGVIVHDDGRVEVGPPPPCPACGGKQTYDDMQINGSQVKVTTECEVCGKITHTSSGG